MKRYLKFLGPILFLCGYSYLLTSYPIVVTDEPWYASTAYNFMHGLGLVNTSCGWRGGDELFLYTVMLGGWFKIFGVSLLSGRAMSVVLGAVSLLGCWTFAREQRFSRVMTVGLMTLFSVSNLVFVVARRIRPEIVVLVCLVWGIVWMGRALYRKGSLKFGPLLMALTLFLLSGFAHPLGFFVAFSAGVSAFFLPSLTFSDRFKMLTSSIVLACGIVLVYGFLWDFLKDGSLWAFVHTSLFESQRLSVSGGFFDTFLVNCKTIFPSYVLGVKRLFIVIVEGVVLVLGLTLFRKSVVIRFLSGFTLVFLLSTFFLMHYFYRVGFVFPHVILIFVMVLMVHQAYPLISRKWQLGLIGVVICYGVNHLAGDAIMLWNYRHIPPYAQLESRLDALVPDDAVVLTHLPFWFAMKSNQIYHNNTYYPSTSFSDTYDPKLPGVLDYAVLTDAFSTGRSPTTGEMESLYGTSHSTYYAQAMAIVRSRPTTLMDTVTIPGYGSIRVYRFD